MDTVQSQQLAALTQMITKIVENVLLEKKAESWNIDALTGLSASIASTEYAMLKMRDAKRFADPADLIDYACANANVAGLVLEFGVFSGSSINRIARSKTQKIFGFDSFEGLPEDWRPGFEKGTFARPGLPQVAPNVELVVGWFDRVLPTFLDNHPGPVSLVHIDADLYSSTQTVLSALRDRIVPGTIILFDEYFNYPEWLLHEFKAFKEFVESTDIKYEYIGIVPTRQQVAVRILSAPH